MSAQENANAGVKCALLKELPRGMLLTSLPPDGVILQVLQLTRAVLASSATRCNL